MADLHDVLHPVTISAPALSWSAPNRGGDHVSEIEVTLQQGERFYRGAISPAKIEGGERVLRRRSLTWLSKRPETQVYPEINFVLANGNIKPWSLNDKPLSGHIYRIILSDRDHQK